MDERMIAVAAGAWGLLWLASAIVPGVLGKRRARAGVPGGRRAVASALLGSALPAFLCGLCVVRAVWADEPPVWLLAE